MKIGHRNQNYFEYIFVEHYVHMTSFVIFCLAQGSKPVHDIFEAMFIPNHTLLRRGLVFKFERYPLVCICFTF